MSVIPKVSVEAVSETQANGKTLNGLVMDVIAIICGLGVVALIGAATSGLDMSAGFF
jgi:hypothetical protein